MQDIVYACPYDLKKGDIIRNFRKEENFLILKILHIEDGQTVWKGLSKVLSVESNIKVEILSIKTQKKEIKIIPIRRGKLDPNYWSLVEVKD